MTFVYVGRLRSGKLLRRNALTKIGSVLHALQARFPLRRRLRLMRGLLRKSCTLRLLPLLLASLQEGRLRRRGLGMHLVLRPVRLPLLLLDLGPARGVEVCLVARPVRESALLPPRLLRELGRGKLLVRSGLPLPALLPRLPLPAHHSTLYDVVSRESLRGSAPVLDPPVFPDLRIEEQGRIVEPALGRIALVTGPVVLALALLTTRGQAVESVAGGTRLDRCPPASGHGLRTDPGRVAFALDLGETGHDPRIYTGLAKTAFDVPGHGLLTTTGRADSIRVPLLAGEVAVTANGHAIPLAALVTTRGHVRGIPPPLTACGHGREDKEPDVSNRSIWRRSLSPRLLLSLGHLLQ